MQMPNQSPSHPTQAEGVKGVYVVVGILLGFVFIVALGLYFRATANSISAEETATTPAKTYRQEEFSLYFSGDSAYAFAEEQLGFGHRPTGSPQLELARQRIIQILESQGWEVVVQPFQHSANGQVYEGRNIIAKKGTGPITIIGSHYDSRLLADNDPIEDKRTEGVPGANDGASSTGALLELAGVIDDHYTVTNQIWLVFFDAEDNGRIPGWDWIIGSTYMAQNLQELGFQALDVEFMLLLDMVGEADGQEFLIESYSLQSAPDQVVAIWQAAGILGYADYFPPVRRGPITDDHLPFIQQGIPAVDIIDLRYPYWHTTDDTLDKISPQSLDRVGEVVEFYLIRSGRIELK
jgi:Zn-dependent M28 family amino/carboxypeptidase